MAAPGQDLLGLIHISSVDPISCCATVAAEVFSRWQLGGQALTPETPSMLLVNAGDLDPDPVWQLVGESHGTGVRCAKPGAALKNMRRLAARRNAVLTNPAVGDAKVRSEWRQIREAGFGTARCGGYAAMWDSSLGLITGPSHDIVLRLDTAGDHKAFRHDVKSRPERLLMPEGLDDHLQPVHKMVAVCGTITVESWDRELVTDILTNELPVLFLPHATPDHSLLRNLIRPLMTEASHISPWEHLTRQLAPMISLPPWPDRPWLKRLESVLRSRSHFLPPGYQFFLLRTIRELIPVCFKIVDQVPAGQLPGNMAALVASDLIQMTLWSMVAGVECLTWHGWGLASGPPSPELLNVLNTIRDGGPMSRQQLRRKTGRIKAGDLDAILEVLTDQGLVMVDPQGISAVTLRRFLTDLTRRGILPPLELLTKPYIEQMRDKVRSERAERLGMAD